MTTKGQRWQGPGYMYVDYAGHSVSHPVKNFRTGTEPGEFEWIDEDGRELIVQQWHLVIAVRFQCRIPNPVPEAVA